jgi:hypothetical protein
VKRFDWALAAIWLVTMVLVLLSHGCASVQKTVAPPVLAALQVEGDLADVLVYVDQFKQEHATSKSDNDAWRATRDKMRATLHGLHTALVGIIDALGLKGPTP